MTDLASQQACSDDDAHLDSLFPSDSIAKCNGQDISRRGGRSKSLMILLPAELSFLKNTDGDFAYLENSNSPNPELVVELEGGSLRYKGKFMETQAAFLTIDIQPNKTQSVCNDLTTRVLAFETPKFEVGNSIEMSKNVPDMSNDDCWRQHFGCSSAAQPQLVKCTSSQRRRLSAAPKKSRNDKSEPDVLSNSSDDNSTKTTSKRKRNLKEEKDVLVSTNVVPQGAERARSSRESRRKSQRVSYCESSEDSVEDVESDASSEYSAWDE